MIIKVEFIYDDDCPNVTATRENLMVALSEVGIQYELNEWCRQDKESPLHVKNYGSPTILINGCDLSEGESSPNCCRIYTNEAGEQSGVPSVQMIKRVLEKEKSCPSEVCNAISKHSWLRGLAVVPAVGAALLPVLSCPACWPAYAGLLSALGLGFFNYTPYLFPVTVILVIIALWSLAYRARQQRGYGPFLLGLLGGTLIIGGRFWFEDACCTYIGVSLLIAVTIWNLIPSNRK